MKAVTYPTTLNYGLFSDSLLRYILKITRKTIKYNIIINYHINGTRSQH